MVSISSALVFHIMSMQRLFNNAARRASSLCPKPDAFPHLLLSANLLSDQLQSEAKMMSIKNTDVFYYMSLNRKRFAEALANLHALCAALQNQPREEVMLQVTWLGKGEPGCEQGQAR